MSVAPSLLPTETKDKYIQEWGKNNFKNQGNVFVSRFNIYVILKLCTNRHAHFLILKHSSWSTTKRDKIDIFEKSNSSISNRAANAFAIYTQHLIHQRKDVFLYM
jgi:hypothetical protein